MKSIITLAIALFIGVSAYSQSTFLDLTIVESSNYNKPIGNFSFSNFESTFKITSPNRPVVAETNINRALQLFLNILEPHKSYIIQHEPTYYFVFQYDTKESRYLVMNNSIGEKNEALYCPEFRQAVREMHTLLSTFYNNIPMVSVKEYK
ncbi:MAG: hypothetical protein LBU91_03975 [Bacteroidales bacterium]|jgi:hypothetical protein|nr:hypothetical protein [Bacteroidales bacterium]